MAVKEVELPEIGTLKLYKRKDLRSIKLSVTATGQVRVSLPYWLPFDAGTKFALTKRDWIRAQLQDHSSLLVHGQAIGKSHHLYFASSPSNERVSTRIETSLIKVSYPLSWQASNPEVQKAAISACIRALRSQSAI